MELEALEWLASEQGRELLAGLDDGDDGDLRLQSRLRRLVAPEIARAAAELVLTRRKARGKFPSGRLRWMDAEGYEQASGELAAEHRARRFAGCERVFDLCCGIGADAVALSDWTETVAVDIDPVRCRLAALNLGETCAHWSGVVCADVTEWNVAAEHVFIDPSRRREGRRVRDPEATSPPTSWATGVAAAARGGAVKLSPAARTPAVVRELGAETEFVSVAGECREQVIWFGARRCGVAQRAVVLPAGESVENDGTPGPVSATAVQAWVFIPDPAVGRARLADACARRFGLSRLALRTQVLTGSEPPATALLRAYRVDEWLPYRPRHLRRHFRQRNLRPDEVIARGCHGTASEMRRLFPAHGEVGCAALFLDSVDGPGVVLSFAAG